MEEKEWLFHVVLVEPEIPPNTGNIARTCAITGMKLHLVKPLGFSIDDKAVKRAGLDYWDHLELEVHESLGEFLEKYKDRKMYLATTHGGVRYTDVRYERGSFLLFGKETAGLPKELSRGIPMPRCGFRWARTRTSGLSICPIRRQFCYTRLCVSMIFQGCGKAVSKNKKVCRIKFLHSCVFHHLFMI